MNKNNHKRLTNHGFTIIELLIALAISAVVMSAIYSTFYSQQKSYVAQEQVASMQKNIRSAMYYMQREIRMAGCDPSANANAGILTANANSINFTEDIRGKNDGEPPDGDTDDANENITYILSGTNLQRNGHLIAENIDALNFVYLNSNGADLQDDGNGNVTIATNISQIKSVQITIVAKTGKGDLGYADTTIYTNQQGAVILPAQNDNFRRKRLTTNIKCRNL